MSLYSKQKNAFKRVSVAKKQKKKNLRSILATLYIITSENTPFSALSVAKKHLLVPLSDISATLAKAPLSPVSAKCRQKQARFCFLATLQTATLRVKPLLERHEHPFLLLRSVAKHIHSRSLAVAEVSLGVARENNQVTLPACVSSPTLQPCKPCKPDSALFYNENPCKRVSKKILILQGLQVARFARFLCLRSKVTFFDLQGLQGFSSNLAKFVSFHLLAQEVRHG